MTLKRFSKTYLFLLLLSIIVSLQSCTYQLGEFYDYKNKRTISEIDYLEFNPKVLIIDVKNQFYFSDSLSASRNAVVDSLLFENKRLRIRKKIVSPYDYEQVEIANELNQLDSILSRKHEYEEMKIPPAILNLMKREESEVLSVNMINGYFRSYENMDGLVAATIIGNALLIPLTGFAYVPSQFTDPYKTSYRLIVFDKSCECVYYYNKVPDKDQNIMNERKMREEITSMYRTMFFSVDK